MNFLRKGWCRAYQLVFRLALPFLPYRTPQLLHRVQDVPGALKQEGISRILLVTDARIRGAGLTASLEQALSESGILCTVYDDTVANPTVDNVEAARQRYLQQQCQGLIAFGGGSSIDCAKAVGARLAQPKKTLGEMNGILKIHRRLPVLVAIPTTAGTGSETTLAAVITDPATHHKYPINDFPLIPRYAVLDPEVTRSLPPFVTATTGMDALTHAIEAYIGGSTTCETRAAATKAVQLIFTYLKRAVENGSDMEAREQMLQAAFLAGSAFSKSYVGYVHAVAHSLGGRYNIPHGLANSVLLPIVLEAYGPSAEKKLHQLSYAAGLSTPEESDAIGAAALIRAIRRMNREMGIPTRLEGIHAEDIPQLARYADREANPLYPVPRLWDHTELEYFYYAVMEGAPQNERVGDPSDRGKSTCLLSNQAHPAGSSAH